MNKSSAFIFVLGNSKPVMVSLLLAQFLYKKMDLFCQSLLVVDTVTHYS